MTGETAALLLPAIRWDPRRGFDGERRTIEQGLALGVGGFILFGGPAPAVRELGRELHARSRIPLLVGSDLERGAGQQFPGLTGLPPLAALASLRDPEVIRRAAALTAREARRVGVNWVYGPVCDLDVVPENPIVGTRAMGGDPALVAELAAEWVDACQTEGALACAKHFPGHGRTTADSHAELPVVHAGEDTLFGEDLVPFRAAIDAGVASVMSAHVAYPALDASGAPATLSSLVLGDLLRRRLGYDGLVVTDALIMEGVLAHGELTASVRALQAGCDLLLYPTDLDGVARAIARAVGDGVLEPERIRHSLRRRQRWAEWAAVGPADLRDTDVPLRPDPWGHAAARRVVHQLRGRRYPLGPVIEVAIVDDDLGGPYPPPSREPFLERLAAGGARVEVVELPGGHTRAPLVIALFGDIRSWKGRPGYSAASRRRVALLCEAAGRLARDAVVVQFSHPRLAAEIPEAANVLCAWGGERVMQEAVGELLLER